MEFLFLAKFRQFKKTGGGRGGGFSYINFGSELGHPFSHKKSWTVDSAKCAIGVNSAKCALTSPLRPHLAESAVHSPFQSLLG
jgi:hypothetical protein